jgi:heme exporter protein D
MSLKNSKYGTHPLWLWAHPSVSVLALTAASTAFVLLSRQHFGQRRREREREKEREREERRDRERWR